MKRSAARQLSLAIVAVFTIAATAAAGGVRGRVNPPSAPPAPETPEGAFYWNAWNGFLSAREARVDPRRDLTVVLRGSSEDEPSGCEYAISGGDLMPRTMVAQAGGTIRIENKDGTPHELSIEGLEGGAPLATAPGNARPLTVAAGGPYAVTDALYGHVHGTIVAVDDLVACGSFGDDGRFEFADIAPGEYQLVVLRNGEEIHTQAVTVGDGTSELERIAL